VVVDVGRQGAGRTPARPARAAHPHGSTPAGPPPVGRQGRCPAGAPPPYPGQQEQAMVPDRTITSP